MELNQRLRAAMIAWWVAGVAFVLLLAVSLFEAFAQGGAAAYFRVALWAVALACWIVLRFRRRAFYSPDATHERLNHEDESPESPNPESPDPRTPDPESPNSNPPR